MTSQQQPDYDAIVVGAGFAGLALIHYLREAGLSIRVFDRASDIGGTWTWNRYPGAMTDSESYYYCLTFSKELLQEWSWTNRYPDWKETLDYMHFVADKCDMWRDIQLNTEIVAADYQADSGHWLVTTGAGYAIGRNGRRDLAETVRFVLWGLLGGLIAYNYFALGQPGTEWLKVFGMWAGMATTLIGGMVGLSIYWLRSKLN